MKRKTAGYATNYVSNHHILEESVGNSMESSPQFPIHRNNARKQNMASNKANDMNYVNDHLGGLQNNYGGNLKRSGVNPVPLSLFGQVQQGRVRRYSDINAVTGGMGPNPAYRFDLSSEV